MNQLNIIGRVGKDPEVRTLESGKLAKFTLAVSEKFTKNGEKVEETEWFNVTLFGKLAEVAEKWVTKGDHLFVTGKIKSREWEDKEGTKRRFYEVHANGLEMLGGKKSESETEIFPKKHMSSGLPENIETIEDPFSSTPYAQSKSLENPYAQPPSHRIPPQDPPNLGDQGDLPF
jgi:single-strand DNA-binding protein